MKPPITPSDICEFVVFTKSQDPIEVQLGSTHSVGRIFALCALMLVKNKRPNVEKNIDLISTWLLKKGYVSEIDVKLIISLYFAKCIIQELVEIILSLLYLLEHDEKFGPARQNMLCK
jgi:hypothetical protein